jgi:hypothetical protein
MRVAAALQTAVASNRVNGSARVLVALAATGAGLCGCGGGGRLDLVLDLPEDAMLRPDGMTTVTVVAQPFEDDPIETTSVLDGDRFSAGDLPAGEAVTLAVELRDGTGRLVGYGRSATSVELSTDDVREVRISVRRPFLYAASTAGLFTFDPTRDQLDVDHQGRLAPASPLRTVPVGDDQLAIINAGSVEVIATEDHQLTGTSANLITTPNDAASVPGTRDVVLGTATGFTIVDLDTGDVTPIAGPAVSRVTVGVLGDGRVIAYGLVGRITVPEVDEGCTGTSAIASIDLAAPDTVTMQPLSVGLADIAAGIDAPALVGAASCASEVVTIDGATTTPIADLSRAALVAIQGTRVWAVGTEPAKIRYAGATIDYVEDDAIAQVISVDIRGGGPLAFALPRRRETMIDTDDPAREHAQVMKPMSALPIDLVVLAGGEFVAIGTRYMFHSNALVQSGPFGNITVLPVMDATTSDLILIDGATTTAAQRVRSQCDLTTGNADIFPNWECGATDEAEMPRFAEFETLSLGALFGAR